MITEEQLQDIIGKIHDVYSVRKIVVFGSYARGDAHQDSDLNLCVIVAPGEEQPLEEWPAKSWLYRATKLSQRIATAEVAVDPHVFTEGEFDALREREHPLVGQILEEGRVVYEQ
jgi:predicted nucleotidyltransferase